MEWDFNMTRIRALLFALCLGLIASIVAVQPSEHAEAASNRQVWVYYMGFWGGGQTWDWQADVLTDTPQIGKYDSRDPGVVSTQIDQAKSAGIDAFLVSWFGVGEGVQTTPVLNNMLDRAAERGFHAAAVIDVFNPAFNRNRDELAQSLNYLINDRANHPGYLRYNGKPVIFFAFQDRLGFTNADWQALRNQVDPSRSTIWIAEGVNGCCLYGGAMDGMYAFNLAWANGSASRYSYERNYVMNNGGTFYAPTVHPGWDEDRVAAKEHRDNPTSRRDRANGQFLSNSFKNATTIGSDVIIIGSWNEFMENSHIEPSQVYGTQSLDILRTLINEWKGAGAPGAGSAAHGIEANYRLNVRSGPGTGYAVLGVIAPGVIYPIVGQQASWYAITYNGQTGYVSAAYVTLR
jgi:hypothetical protein